MRQSEIIRVSSKGQIVLPKRFREQLDIHDGDYVTVCETEGMLMVEKTPESKLDTIAAELRAEARRKGFTREDLAEAVKAARRRMSPNAG